MSENHRDILVASEFVSACAATARRKDFNLATVGSEMLKHGYALLFDVPLDLADRAVFSMLKLYDQKFLDVAKDGADSN